MRKNLILIFTLLFLCSACKTPLGTKFSTEQVDTSDWMFYKYLNTELKINIAIHSGIDLYLSSISYDELKVSKNIISFYKQTRNKSEILLFGNTYDTINKKVNLSIFYHKNEKEERLYRKVLEEAVNSTIERKSINKDAVVQNFIIGDYHFFEIIHYRTAPKDFIRLQYFSKQNSMHLGTNKTRIEKGIVEMYNRSKMDSI